MKRVGLVLTGFRDPDVMGAMAALARKLSAQGHQPVFLLPPVCDEDARTTEEALRTVLDGPADMVRLESAPFTVEASPHAAKAYETYLWLNAHSDEFDALVAPETLGTAYYTLLARQEGLVSSRMPMFCLIVGPTLRHLQRLGRTPTSVKELELHFMEEQSVRLAPTLICDNAEVLEWMRNDDWTWSGSVMTSDDFALQSFERPASGPVKTQHDVTLPSVTVCITHHNRPHMLRQAVESLEQQDYPNYSVIVVDDGSTKPDALAELDRLERAFKPRGWRIIRQENQYLGAARNNGARHATGDYVIFFDDDNYAHPDMISRFVPAARHSGADIITSSMDRFAGAERPDAETPILRRYIPLGGSATVGVFRNCFGDAARYRESLEYVLHKPPVRAYRAVKRFIGRLLGRRPAQETGKS